MNKTIELALKGHIADLLSFCNDKTIREKNRFGFYVPETI